jgi:hypothetical protein
VSNALIDDDDDPAAKKKAGLSAFYNEFDDRSRAEMI